MSKLRDDKISAELKRLIYDILSKNVHGITEMFGITKVDANSDLKDANVFISIYSADKMRKEKTYAAIKNSAALVRRSLAQKMRTRTVPEIHFILDEGMEHSSQIDKLLNQIKENKK